MTTRRIVAWGAWLAAFLWIFGGVLFRPQNFAYRDAAHFYYPLFQYVQEEWQAGRAPLWNPYQNGGEPLAANATASVWYPAKLLFWLPLEYDWAYKLYILAHVALAAATMAWLVRGWGGSIEAAALAALSYALGANVMFQYANVVFLCGAAWLPAALRAGQQMLGARNWRWAAWLGAILALMVTAGDPQMAYQAGLLVALLALIQARLERPASDQKRPPIVLWAWRPMLLAQAAAWAAALSAVQLLPAIELARHSDRGYFDLPRSLYEIPTYLLRDTQPPPHPDGSPAAWHDALRGRPSRPLSHDLHQHDFSVAPWRLVELVWPNLSGRTFPGYRRWLSALGNDPDYWTPSLYLGILPLLLACSLFTLRGANAGRRWYSWMVLFGIVGSWGSYGLGWLLRQLAGASEGEMPLGDAVGGLYWLFNVALPGYVQFRFPGKLMVVAALGLAGLAAQAWDGLEKDSARRLARWLAALGLFSLALLLAVFGLRDFFIGALANTPPDPLFGPFDAHGAWLDVCRSLLHTAAFSGVWWWLLRATGAKPDWPLLRWAAVPLCALDLAIANAWMVLAAPAHAWHGTSQWAAQIAAGDHGPAPVRFFETPNLAAQAWLESASPERPAEVVSWQRHALTPNFHLSSRLSSVRAAGTSILFDYEQFMSPAARQEDARVDFIRPRRALDAWGAAYFVLPPDEHPHDPTRSTLGLRHGWLEPSWLVERPQPLPEGKRLTRRHPPPAGKDGPASELHVLLNTAAFPRAWIVHQVLPVAPLESHEQQAVQPLMQAMLFPDQQWIDLRHMAIVEDAALAEAAGGRPWWLATGDEMCRITHYEPGRVELDAHLRSPGLVVLADTFYPGWSLQVETSGHTRPVNVLRTNRLMRGVLLPAGDHRLVYSYLPATFTWGATVSVVSLLLLASSLRPRRMAADGPSV